MAQISSGPVFIIRFHAYLPEHGQLMLKPLHSPAKSHNRVVFFIRHPMVWSVMLIGWKDFENLNEGFFCLLAWISCANNACGILQHTGVRLGRCHISFHEGCTLCVLWGWLFHVVHDFECLWDRRSQLSISLAWNDMNEFSVAIAW